MADLIDRQKAVEVFCSACGLNFPLCDMCRSGKYRYWICAVPALWELPTAQPERKIEELLPDGTLLLSTDADLSKVGRVLVSQNGTHYGCLYYADAQPERNKGKLLPHKAKFWKKLWKCSECGVEMEEDNGN